MVEGTAVNRSSEEDNRIHLKSSILDMMSRPLIHAITVKEDNDKFKIIIGAKGYQKDDFEVFESNGKMHVRTKWDHSEGPRAFSRSIKLPKNANFSEFDVRYVRGILVVCVEKLSKS